MKKRIKIDSALLSCIIILTGFLFAFRGLYPRSPFLDDALDFIGFVVLMMGTLLRMSARGHKKAHSNKGGELVISGPYTLVRNPMYLGSFLMGAGFILMVWPWWSLPIFGALFYVRFKKQIIKEEQILSKIAGEEYNKYCKKVHRMFPSLKLLSKVRLRKIVNLKEAFSTKEKSGLWTWPLLAIVLESFQEMLVFEETIIGQTVTIFLAASVVFIIGFWFFYNLEKIKFSSAIRK